MRSSIRPYHLYKRKLGTPPLTPQTNQSRRDGSSVRRSAIFFFLFLVLGIQISACSQQLQEQPKVFSSDYFDNLDYGLYWFGPNKEFEKAHHGEPSAYYDPQAPTVIYIHGWDVGETRNQYREVFDYAFLDGPEDYLADAWINDGWNIGVFYWNQISDEIIPHFSENKIWTHRSMAGMRWTNSKGQYRKSDIQKSVSDLLFENYATAMANYQGDHVRLVGHSFGNQLAIILGHRLLKSYQEGAVTENILPSRVALLDPAYMGGPRYYLNWKSTAQQSQIYAEELLDSGIAIESYQSSPLMLLEPITDRGLGLLRLTAHTHLRPHYYNFWDLQALHVTAAWYYFKSYQFNPPKILFHSGPGLSASTPDWRVKQLMTRSAKLTQIWGTQSITPQDDMMIFNPL